MSVSAAEPDPPRRLTPSAAWIGLAVGVVGIVICVLAGRGPVALGGDNASLHHPMFVDVVRQLDRGVVPAWTTGRWGGSPLVGDPVLGAMYPANYLGYLLEPFPHARAIDVASCVHLAVFAAGFLWCLRRLRVRPSLALVAVALATVDPTVAYVGRSWINWWGAISWWPWLFGAVVPTDARQSCRPGIAAASLAAQVYAGYPQFALYSGTIALATLMLGAHAPLRRRLADAAIVAFGAGGLAALQVLPGMAMAAESMRLGPGGTARLAALDAVAIAPGGWFDVFAASPTLGRLPCKLGLPVVVLALAGIAGGGRIARVLGVAAVTCAAVATEPTPLAGALHHLPGFSFFAGPFKFFYPAAFVAHVLAGIGLEAIARGPATIGRAAVATVAVAAWPALGWAGAAALLVLATLPRRALCGAAGAAALVAGVAFFARTEAWSTPQPFARDAFTPLLHGPPPGADGGALARWIALDEGPALRQVGMNFGALWGLASVSGVGPLPPWRQFEVLDDARPGTAPELAKAVGATRVVVRGTSALAPQLQHGGYSVVARDERFLVLAPPTEVPFAFLAARARTVPAADAVDAARAGMAIEPELLVEGDPTPGVEEGDAAGRIEIRSSGDTRHELRVSVTRPTWLVVRQPYYRGWRAWIDERPARVQPVGGFLTGVRVDAGTHDVVLAYPERGLAVGALVSAGTALALLALLRRRRTVEKAGPLA